MNGDHPHVSFPPPLLYVAGFLLGLSVQQAWEVRLPRSPVFLVGGWALMGLGLVLVAWALWTFWRRHTGILPHHPASELVAHGPYAFTRNPMYVALALLYVGLALWLRVAWPLVLLPLVLWSVWRFVIRREEAYLRRAFGPAYDAYQKRVRRWL